MLFFFEICSIKDSTDLLDLRKENAHFYEIEQARNSRKVFKEMIRMEKIVEIN
jgi:hypothetical protein